MALFSWMDSSDQYCFIFCRCSDGQCISVSLLCDYYPDCIHGEDEDCCEYLTMIDHPGIMFADRQIR